MSPAADDPGFARTLGEIRHEISSTLDGLYPSLDLADLPIISEALEDFAINRAFQALLDNAVQICACHPAGSPGAIFDLDGNLFQVSIAPGVPDRDLLAVGFVGFQQPRATKPKQRTSRIRGLGQFRRVRIYYDPRLAVKTELVQAIVLAVFETAYAWYKARVEALATEERIYLGRALYQAAAVLFPSDALRENLWFACVTEKHGYRLLDPLVTAKAFEIVERAEVAPGFSTNRLVAEIVATILPRQKLLMQEAIRARRCIDVSLVNASYRKEGSIYAVALRALYNSDSISMYPIVTDGPVAVIALFPTSVRSQIEPTLDTQASHLARVCERSTSRMRRAVQLFERNTRSLPFGAIGEFVGGLLKEFVKPW